MLTKGTAMEYGIFTDEGCVEDGFFERKAAETRAAFYRASGDNVVVHQICPDHPEQPAHACEDCDTDGDE